MARFGTAIAVLAVLLGSARAEDDCDKFAWPLVHERALFAATGKLSVKAGETFAAIPKDAFVLRLQADAGFAMPPERKPKSEKWFGGIVRLQALDKPSIYQVTLSEEAWIDVVQDGRYARSVGSSGRSDCPGVRKSVRFQLGAAPFVLQLSGATSDSVAVAIGARE
jgi:hypothetical protein